MPLADCYWQLLVSGEPSHFRFFELGAAALRGSHKKLKVARALRKTKLPLACQTASVSKGQNVSQTRSRSCGPGISEESYVG